LFRTTRHYRLRRVWRGSALLLDSVIFIHYSISISISVCYQYININKSVDIYQYVFSYRTTRHYRARRIWRRFALQRDSVIFIHCSISISISVCYQYININKSVDIYRYVFSYRTTRHYRLGRVWRSFALQRDSIKFVYHHIFLFLCISTSISIYIYL